MTIGTVFGRVIDLIQDRPIRKNIYILTHKKGLLLADDIPKLLSLNTKINN